MLNKYDKLVGHEFRQTSKQFLPVFAALIAMVLLTTILISVGGLPMSASMNRELGDASAHSADNLLGRVLRIVTAFCFGMTLFGLIAFVAVVFVMSIMRFYKNMLGDEGYLMFTLPVTPAQHLFAKLTAAVTWTVGAVILAILSVLLFVTVGTRGAIWGEIYSSQSPEIGAMLGAQAALLPWALLASVIMGIAAAYLMLYLCMAIGAQWMQNRALASIVAYVALSTLLQVLGIILLLVTGNFFARKLFYGLLNTVNYPPLDILFLTLNVLCLIAMAVCIVCSVVCFFVTKHLLTKKLNLA